MDTKLCSSSCAFLAVTILRKIQALGVQEETRHLLVWWLSVSQLPLSIAVLTTTTVCLRYSHHIILCILFCTAVHIVRFFPHET